MERNIKTMILEKQAHSDALLESEMVALRELLKEVKSDESDEIILRETQRSFEYNCIENHPIQPEDIRSSTHGGLLEDANDFYGAEDPDDDDLSQLGFFEGLASGIALSAVCILISFR